MSSCSLAAGGAAGTRSATNYQGGTMPEPLFIDGTTSPGDPIGHPYRPLFAEPRHDRCFEVGAHVFVVGRRCCLCGEVEAFTSESRRSIGQVAVDVLCLDATLTDRRDRPI
jgi:hypothetical protein